MDLSNLSSDLPPTKPINQISVNELNHELTTEFKNAAKSVAALYNSSILSKCENVSSNDFKKNQKLDFANAAKSVATLYRLSNNANTLLLNKGYLECLDDLLEGIAHGDDIENWALTKRAEITNINKDHHNNSYGNNNNESNVPSNITNNNNNISNIDSMSNNDLIEPITNSTNEPEFNIPPDHVFSLTLDKSPGCKFRPSFPPLSVTHSHKFKSNSRNHRKQESLVRRKLRLQARQGHSQEDSTASSEYESEFDLEENKLEERRFENKVSHKLKSNDDDGSLRKKRKTDLPSNPSDKADN